jgi:hypothetical protein
VGLVGRAGYRVTLRELIIYTDPVISECLPVSNVRHNMKNNYDAMKVDLVVSCQNHISRSRSSFVLSPSFSLHISPLAFHGRRWFQRVGEARSPVYRKEMRLRGDFGSCNGQFA